MKLQERALALEKAKSSGVISRDAIMREIAAARQGLNSLEELDDDGGLRAMFHQKIRELNKQLFDTL